MSVLFEECCRSASDMVEQEIIKWNGGRYIASLQACSLLARNYPLGAFRIAMEFNALFTLLMFPQRVSLLNGEYVLQRDEDELNNFFETEYHYYGDCQDKEKMMKGIYDDLLKHCMGIIYKTCQFGG